MLKAISLFSGIGGLDFGFEQAGFETRLALELDRHSCATLRLNRPGWEIIEDDINNVPSSAILKRAGLKRGEADILIGGPPCQPFSKSGYWARGDAMRLDDPRADTLVAYLRVLRDVKPRAFLLENVSGLTYAAKDEGLRFLLKGIEQINREARTDYSVHWQVINCADYGVPQLRERVFLVGSREGRPFQFPPTTHAKPDLLSPDAPGLVEPHRTAWDALGDLAEPDLSEPGLEVGGKWGELLPSIPEGENYLWHTDRGGGLPLFGWRTRYWGFLLKLAKNRPAWTIQAQPGTAIGPFHWNNRRFTFQELSRLQTFPADIRAAVGRTEMQRMLGNAVPSLISEILGREIRRQFFDRAKRGSLALLPQRRLDAPRPKRVASVPTKYHALIGAHAPHPGEGKGRMAVKRARERATLNAEK